MSIRNMNIRFNTDKPVYREAYNYLINMDKSKYKSYSNVAAHAIVEYFERRESNISPFFATEEREKLFAEKISSAVEKSFSDYMEKYFGLTGTLYEFISAE